MESAKHANEVPGPGTYPIMTTLDVPAITLKPRLPDFTIRRRNYVPGPGAYDPPPLINGLGRYISSNHINSRASRFSIPKSPTSRHNNRTSPGPGECTFDLMQTEFLKA